MKKSCKNYFNAGTKKCICFYVPQSVYDLKHYRHIYVYVYHILTIKIWKMEKMDKNEL